MTDKLLTRRQRVKNSLREWCDCGDGPTMAPARFRGDTPGGRGVREAEPLVYVDRRLRCAICRWLDRDGDLAPGPEDADGDDVVVGVHP